VPDLRESSPCGIGTRNTGWFAGGAFTVTIASPAVVTYANHRYALGDIISFTTTGALPTGFTANTNYYVIPINANTFNLATTKADAITGTKITTSGSQSGTHSIVVTHDSLTLGQFGDNMFQGHYVDTPVADGLNYRRVAGDATVVRDYVILQSASATKLNLSPITDGINGTPKTGNTTRGKIVGVNFIIKT